jgi:hypothetical protein
MTRPLRQQARILDAVIAGMTPFREVPSPVDVTDAETFPEIARAIAHAKARRDALNMMIEETSHHG